MSKQITTNYERGSEWRKWDLHVHTPESFYNNYKGVNGDIWEAFIKDLEILPPEFKVLGVNDYLFIDGYQRLLKEKKENGRLSNIDMLLPVIELRLKKFCGSDSKLSKVNFHIIFSPEIKPDIIQQHFLNAIPRHYQLTPQHSSFQNNWQALATKKSLEELGQKIKANVPKEKLKDYGSDLQEGFHNINFDEDKILEVLNSSQYFKGKYFTAIGKTEWADIKWTDNSIADKKDVINKVNFVFISSDTPDLYYKSKKQLTDSKVNDLLLDCSDAHNFSTTTVKDRIGNCFTWIKADPTFEGFKQVLNEPVDRVYVGIKPLKLLEVEGNKSKYVDSVKINPISSTNGSEWFNNELPLNNGLVAVIGRKGSGKSAFTDIVSLCGNSKVEPNDYSFLNKGKFRKRGLAENYEATLKWLDGKANEKVNLNSEVNTITEVEKVKYLPQKFVEEICDETGVSTLFQQEIDKIIFAYVPEESRLGALTLDNLITIKTQALEEKITNLRGELNCINARIVRLEDKQRKNYLAGLTKKLDEKERELNALTQPKEIKKPKTTLSKSDQTKLNKITKELEDIENKISEAKNSLKDTNNKISKLDNIKSAVIQLQDKHSELIKKIKADADLLSIDLSNLIKLTIKEVMLSQKEAALSKEKDRLESLLEQNNADSKVSLYTKKAKLQTEKGKITKAFTAEQKIYDDYLEKVRQFKLKQKDIEGTKDDTSLETIKSIEKEIEYVKSNLAKDLQSIRNERIEVLKKLYQELIKKIDFYKEIYNPLTKFIKEEKKTQEESGSMLSFDVSTVFDKQSFANDFFSFLNRNRDGSFQNIVNGQKILDGIIAKYDFKTDTAIINFINDLIEHLNFDKTKNPATENDLRSQIKGGEEENVELYNFLFGLRYLDVRFKVLFNDKDLNSNELSPGEKGALLLIMYLLIDRDNIPLVIDQPEENLDNESVYSLLVPYMKQAKQKRQIIAVTHNPNLAVVCDAEQVIYAQMDKKLNQIRYSSGSIENPETNKRVVDVLEGTMPAFKIRDKKYIRKT